VNNQSDKKYTETELQIGYHAHAVSKHSREGWKTKLSKIHLCMHKTNLLAIQLLFPIHKKDLLTW